MTERQYYGMWAAAGWLVIIFVMAPVVFVMLGSFTDQEYLALPTDAVSLRWYRELANYPQFFDGFWKSMQLGLVAAAFATVFGTLSAIGLSRLRTRYAPALSILLSMPLMVPTVILGLSMLQYFSALRITSAYFTLFIGHIVLTLPYVVRTVGSSLALMERNIEWAAADLGAGPWRVILHVTVPSVAPGVIGGLIFAFVVSFDTATISILLQTPAFVPLPVRLFNFVEAGVSPVLASLSTLLILFSAGVIYLAERIAGVNVIFGMARRRASDAQQVQV